MYRCFPTHNLHTLGKINYVVKQQLSLFCGLYSCLGMVLEDIFKMKNKIFILSIQFGHLIIKVQTSSWEKGYTR